MMNDAEIEDLVSDLVSAVDYDIWKGLFVPSCFEDEPEYIEAKVKELCDVVKRHLTQEG